MNNERTIVILFLLILNISCANIAFSSTNTSPKSLQSLRETIVALDVTRTKSQQTLKQLYVTQDVSLKKDIKEYTVFIEYLSYQIINYCQQINEQYGSRAVADLPCENQMNYSQSVDSIIDTKEVKTSEEQVSALENELMNSMGEFDEMLLKEDEQLAQVSKKQTSGNSSKKGKYSQAKDGSSGNNNKIAEADQENQENEGNGENQESQTGEQQSEKNKVSKSSGSGKGKQKTTGKNQSRERRKLDEIDDDIVARQLKEAAEKETDPQLKEKLWDEYYRYKKKTLK